MGAKSKPSQSFPIFQSHIQGGCTVIHLHSSKGPKPRSEIYDIQARIQTHRSNVGQTTLQFLKEMLPRH